MSSSSHRSSYFDINQLLQDEPSIPPHPPVAPSVSLPPIRQVLSEEFSPSHTRNTSISSLPMTTQTSRGSAGSSEEDEELMQNDVGPIRNRRSRHAPTLSISSTSTTTSAVDEQTGLNRLKRRRADANQLAVLNSVFSHTFFPSTELRQRLGEQLGMSARSVQIWFQNKRQQWRQRKRQDEQQGRMPQQPVYVQPLPHGHGMMIQPQFGGMTLGHVDSVPLGGVVLGDPMRQMHHQRMPEPHTPSSETVIQTRPLPMNVQPFLMHSQPGTPPDTMVLPSYLAFWGQDMVKGGYGGEPLTPLTPLLRSD